MPFVVWAIVRAFRALRTTLALLVDVKLMRTLPWPYIRRLPFHRAWIGVITATLALTLACAVGGLVVPGEVGRQLAVVGWYAAICGVVSSWIRALHQRWRLRR